MKRILIIDDDTEFRKMLTVSVAQAGYEIVEAANGKEGMKKYQSEKIDLVVTDIFMPEKEGIETIMELRAIDPDIKIIGISGGGIHKEFGFLENLSDFGAQRTFQKPFALQDFLVAIEELLGVEE